MDLQFLREPALILFASSMAVEVWVWFETFFDKDSLPVPSSLKWMTSVAFVFFSSVNLWAFQEVYFNTALSNPLITKMLYCFGGLLVMGSLHFLNAWVKNYVKELESR